MTCDPVRDAGTPAALREGKSPLKVLYINGSAGVGGVERMLEDTVVRLAGRVQSRVLLPREGELACRLRGLGVPVDVCDLGVSTLGGRLHIGMSPRGLAQAMRAARDFRPDLVRVHSSNVALYGLAASLAGVAPVLLLSHFAWDQRRWLQRVLTRLTCSRIVAVSEHIGAAHRQRGGWFASRTFVLHPGVDTLHFGVSAGVGECKRAVGLDARVPVVSIVGRLDPVKGYELFLDAAERVAGKLAECRFVVVGGTVSDAPCETESYAESIRVRVERSALLRERIVFSGPVSDVRPWLQASDLVVCTSRWETFGLAIVEAMSCGVPVVSTDCDGPRETVLDGTTGHLVPAGDAAALASRIEQLLADPVRRRAMGAAARQRATALFDVKRYADELFAHYQAIACPRT